MGKFERFLYKIQGIPTPEEMEKIEKERKRKEKAGEAALEREHKKQLEECEKKEEERLNAKLKERNISREEFDKLSKKEQYDLRHQWTEEEEERKFEQTPEGIKRKELNQRLETLVSKKVTGFEVDRGASVKMKLEDGSTLSFISWDAYNDKPNFDGVEVNPPEKKEEKDKS